MVPTIVMPSFLGHYRGAAKDRERKLVRAVESVFKQNYGPWELVIIADGCPLTMEIVQGMELPARLQGTGNNVVLALIDKQPMFSGTPRNTGIDLATGEWICYLDSDDALAPGHLSSIMEGASKGLDWLFFNDYVLRGDTFVERPCTLDRFRCGTSNIAHKKSMAARWEHINRYGHDDWTFINKLKTESPRWERCHGEYLVCHIPQGKEI